MANIFSAVRKRKVVSGILIVAIAGGAYYFWPRSADTNALAYTYGTVQLGNIVQSVSGTGQVSTTDQVDVKSKIAGNITVVEIKSGQTVKEGDVLAKLAATDAQAAYDSAAANLESARLTLQKSRQDNSLTLEQARNAVTSAQNQLEQSQGDLAKTYEQAFNAV
ncbi:MAG: biotin/lipoyl-binding protein, partial [Candidatus Pacebacteria bacterium]|nr:biotin/lipoyl-binding protein [Candidatus Paceibacterota bacterium]